VHSDWSFREGVGYEVDHLRDIPADATHGIGPKLEGDEISFRKRLSAAHKNIRLGSLRVDLDCERPLQIQMKSVEALRFYLNGRPELLVHRPIRSIDLNAVVTGMVRG